MKDLYRDCLNNTSVPQKGSKGINNVKFHYEGLELGGEYKNFGITAEKLKCFNENILNIITR